MNALIANIESHSALWLLGAGYVLTAAVSALPDPKDPAPFQQKAYHFFYDFVHVLGNSIPSKYRPPVPPAQ